MNKLERTARLSAIDYRHGNVSVDALARSVFPLIRRIAAAAAYGMKMDIADDIAMSVWLAFQQKGIKQWDEGRSIGAYLSVIAKNVSITMYREQAPFAIAQTDNEGEEIETTEESVDSATFLRHSNDPYDTIEKTIAIGAIREKLRYASSSINGSNLEYPQENTMKTNTIMMPGVGVGKVTIPQPVIKAKGERKGYLLSEAQSELAVIYKKLHDNSGMTQAVFAEKLDIGGARLASYLYGRTSSVPEYIMDSARALSKSPDHIKSKFEGLTMPEILKRWAKRLGLKEVDDAKLAPLIGVSISTVCRWRIGDTRPSNVELIRYDASISIVAERMNKTSS